ncbi:MAG: FliI/YscN family ATPase [Planctomycetota bacterium]|nr:FliI/YscN family ATPase [Planctomycetota bacterium]
MNLEMQATLKLPRHLRATEVDETLRGTISKQPVGTVASVQASAVVVAGIRAPVGACCEIESSTYLGQGMVIGFNDQGLLVSPEQGTQGVMAGDRVRVRSMHCRIPVGEELLGRVVDCNANPVDDQQPLSGSFKRSTIASPPPASRRRPIESVLETGVKGIDAFATLGRGQRLGLFAAAGVGKSQLLSMIARGTDADVVVLALVGERGREVGDLLQSLPEDTCKKLVTVVATSDQSATQRVRAAHSATTIAEQFRDSGKHVLLLMDSVTRFAIAQREVGLSAGEIPTTRGFPPSVFAALPQLVERAGNADLNVPEAGSITAIYTVLVEGDDPREPISDTMQGLLDGHVHLSRKIAQAGRYPAIDVPASLSRLQRSLLPAKQQNLVDAARRLIAAYTENEDLIRIGGYEDGTDPLVDQAIVLHAQIENFLKQTQESCSAEKAMQQLASILEAGMTA